MGLIHPTDLPAWHRWAGSRRPLPARAKDGIRALLRSTPHGVLLTGGPRPRVIIALEAAKSTTVAAQLAPLRHLPLDDVAILAPADPSASLPAHDWVRRVGPLHHLAESVVTSDAVVLSTGHYLGVGAAARTALAAVADPRRFVTVQHGLLTPHAPPLAEATTLLAWSAEDGAFWRSGRTDIEVRAVGSQLLWEAAHTSPLAGAATVDPDASPVYLGQLHGSELNRPTLESAARSFCLEHGATYRPHPSETDRASVARHRAWASEGIRLDRSGVPLVDLHAPVVSVYSTGILEAAARGLPAWVDLPHPPPWLTEFWQRCGMHRWGQDPTPVPVAPAGEPARAVAHALLDLLGGSS